jgi:8-oxo-dGTP pyrophosphatase MutT (NUDIX family)
LIIGCICLAFHAGRIIAIECEKGRGIILPGGKPEKGESFKKAASRELLEETGLVAIRQRLIFQGPPDTISYCYCFRTTVEEYPATKPAQNKVVLATWNDLFQNEYSAYYKLLCEVQHEGAF